MPLVFLHGVNTRDTDADYLRSVSARKTMFEQLVVPVMRPKYSSFKVADDIYWGDLGVGFSWFLRSVPAAEHAEQAQGAGQQQPESNLDLAMLLGEPGTPDSEQSMGPDRPLVDAAGRDAGALVRSIFSPESELFAPSNVDRKNLALTPKDIISAEAQGQHLGFLLIAVERFARKVDSNSSLIQAPTDQAVLKRIEDGVHAEYEDIVRPWLAEQAAQSEDQAQGALTDGFAWIGRHLDALINNTRDAVKSAATNAVANAERAGSLALMKRYRDSVTRKGLRFIGDVFVYLQRGRTADVNIYGRVRDKLLAVAAAASESEPLIVVTHSFGSEILYDLLTSGALDKVPIYLWVTVGAQTSLFAEMKLYAGMAKNIPEDTSKFVLGKPAGVNKWINIYDAADALSYLHEPIFGDVKDIAINAQGNLTNAHGHYFVTPVFYELIAKELGTMA